MLFSILVSAGLMSSGLPSGSIEPVTDTLHTVTVTADKGVVVSRKDTISLSGAFSVSDILLRSPGLHLGDNGGYAGLKTVSLRGMGSAHTAVYMDGLRVGNVQSGQNDLGMVDVGNAAHVIVDYAQNSISFNTARPQFGKNPVSGNVRFLAGSFGTYLPYARLDFRLSDRLSLSANASGVFSEGNYRYADGQIRTNNDIRQMKSSLDLFGLTDRGDYHMKAYFNWAERGTPGSVSWPSEDRQKDRNALIQGRMTQRFSSLYTLNLSFKGSYDDIFYTSIWGDSNYGQTEIQLNSSHSFTLTDSWKVSFAADLQWDGLASSNYNASRLNLLSALAASYVSDRFVANAALEYNVISDMDALTRTALSPSADLRYKVFNGMDIVAFARRAYRIPMFNELYYVGYGNPDLMPEDAWMTDLGVDFHRNVAMGTRIYARLDGFCNWLTNKITSAPSPEDPNIWAPYNIGKVLSAGFDAVAGVTCRAGNWRINPEIRYTFQSATDRTQDSISFGQQIPYIARHIGQCSLQLSWKGWNMNPIWQCRAGRTDGTGDLKDWNTIDVDLYKVLSLKNDLFLTFRVAARNIADHRYEVVAGYPMPGRSFIAGVEFKF